MLDKDRIKKAQDNARSYLEEGLLKKTTANKQVMKIFLRNSKESSLFSEFQYRLKTAVPAFQLLR